MSRKGGGEVKQERVRVGGKKNVETEKGRRRMIVGEKVRCMYILYIHYGKFQLHNTYTHRHTHSFITHLQLTSTHVYTQHTQKMLKITCTCT